MTRLTLLLQPGMKWDAVLQAGKPVGKVMRVARGQYTASALGRTSTAATPREAVAALNALVQANPAPPPPRAAGTLPHQLAAFFSELFGRTPRRRRRRRPMTEAEAEREMWRIEGRQR